MLSAIDCKYCMKEIFIMENLGDDENKRRPVYVYPREQRYSSECEYSDEKYGELKKKITENLLELMKNAGY